MNGRVCNFAKDILGTVVSADHLKVTRESTGAKGSERCGLAENVRGIESDLIFCSLDGRSAESRYRKTELTYQNGVFDKLSHYVGTGRFRQRHYLWPGLGPEISTYT